MSKIMDNETQHFIYMIKQGIPVEKALEILTYGYRDDNNELIVATYKLTTKFFIDFIDCSEKPGVLFANVLHWAESYSNMRHMKDCKYGTFTEDDLTNAMLAVMRDTTVRIESDGSYHYVNGFSDIIETFTETAEA